MIVLHSCQNLQEKSFFLHLDRDFLSKMYRRVILFVRYQIEQKNETFISDFISNKKALQ